MPVSRSPLQNKHTVLVVEDTEGQRDLIQRCFEGKAVELTFATDANEAITCAQGRSFDAILLDWRIPHGGGIRVLRTIKNGNKPVVIVLTSSRSLDDVRAAYHAYANAYLVKPETFPQYQAEMAAFIRFWFSPFIELPG